MNESEEEVLARGYAEAIAAAPALGKMPDMLVKQYREEGVDIQEEGLRACVRAGVTLVWWGLGEHINALYEHFSGTLPSSFEQFGERVGNGHSLLDVPEEEITTCLLGHFFACAAMDRYSVYMDDHAEQTGEEDDGGFCEFTGWPLKPNRLALLAHAETLMGVVPFDAQSLRKVRLYVQRWLGEIDLYLQEEPAKSKYH